MTWTDAEQLLLLDISIHTALAGCDAIKDYKYATGAEFQSTQPSQAVTLIAICTIFCYNISIHTALAGCDDAGIG